jgi:hypothetical protein
MHRDAPSNGEMLAAASAVLLSYLMFFDWFGVRATDDTGSGPLSHLNLSDRGRMPGRRWISSRSFF